jgi:8-oxo-dGTP pyrophosphatase MutT (NUDIX family)
MRLSLQARRAAMRLAYAGLRTYWFLARPRIVGVKCILIDGDDVLLVRHTYGKPTWDLPGGTVRRRETPRHAAEREMEEELGRRIEDWTSLGELFVNTNHHDDNLHLFQTHVADRELDLNLTELAEAAWFHRDALPPDVGRFVRAILRRVERSEPV